MTGVPSRRLVLSSGFANGGLQDFVTNSGWPFLYSIPPSATANATQYVWQIDQDYTFHYFECEDYPVAYCQVFGPSANNMLMQISIGLNFLDVNDLAGAFDRSATQEEKRITTFALGLAAGTEPDPKIYERVLAAFRDADPVVRRAAIDGAFVAGWELFRSSLENAATADPDTGVRALAELALSIFHGNAGQGGEAHVP